MKIYQPSDDSYFFADFLKKYLSNLQSSIEGDSLRNPLQSSPVLSQPASSFSMTMLDMGTGSGILAETASKFINKKNILTVDINSESIKLLKQKGFKSIKSNLFEKLNRYPDTPNTESRKTIKSNQRFDLIVFNAPYLPQDIREPKDSQFATTGGKHGDEISIKFLKQAKKHLNKNGKIFLLISSLTPMDKIKKLNPKIITRKKLFMEELLILEFNNPTP